MKYGKKLLLLPLLILGLGLTFFVLSNRSAQAQQNSNYDITVSPVFFDLSANPGSTVNEKVRIRNNTTSPLPIKIEVKKLTGDENGDLTIKDDNSDDSLSWIKFSKKSFIAKPLEWTDVSFTIEIPESAAYGYYFAINFNDANTNKATGTGASVTGAAAVPILLNVRKEGARAEGKLTDFSVGSFINQSLPVNFTATIENTGNVHIKPSGNIFITRGSGNSLATLDINENLSNIIPTTKKTFASSWADGFIVREPVLEDGTPKMDKNGKPVLKTNIYWNKITDFRIGKYTANLVMVYDNGQRDIPIEASKTFWVIPYISIIIAVVVIVLIIFIIRFIMRRYINREVRRRSKQK